MLPGNSAPPQKVNSGGGMGAAGGNK
jgi:hypothetical protein